MYLKFEEPLEEQGRGMTPHTVPTDRILSVKNVRAWVSMDFTANPAHLPQNWAKLAKLAVLFSW